MKKALLIVVILLLAGGGFYFFSKREQDTTYTTAKIERGTVVASVAATGNLSAVTTIQVGTQVSGTLQKLNVDYNSPVKKGQTIAEIDPSIFKAAVEQSQGNALTAQANLQKARVTLADAQRTLQRNRQLLRDGIISQGDFDVSETAVGSAEASLKAAEGSVMQTRGALAQAQTNLSNSIIRSPVDGVVISRAVDVGQTVAASFQTPTLFTIAKDLTKMQIEVSVDEADISRIRVGQTATFTVDAYPEQTFSGKVVQVRSAPVVTQNVVTYVVVVNLDNREMKLKPGMTANVSIEIARRDNVLKLPAAALRFHPKTADSTKAASTRRAAGDRKTDSSSNGKGGGKDREGKKGGQKVYILKEKKPVAVQVTTGIANNSSIELLEGSLKEGDDVILQQSGGTDQKKKSSGMMGSPMGSRPH